MQHETYQTVPAVRTSIAETQFLCKIPLNAAAAACALDYYEPSIKPHTMQSDEIAL